MEKLKNKKALVPNLRFPGFSGEWNSCELGDIAELSKGAGISKDQRSSDGDPCILYGELYTTYLTEIIDDVVSKTNLEPIGLVKSKANDIIIPASGETAIDISTARCVLHDDVLLGGDLNIIRLNEHDGKFFSYQLNGVRKKDIARIAHGVSIVHLHGNALAHIVVNYPSRREQEKIASLMSLIDQRITIQNKIIERYESLIKALAYETIGKYTPNTMLSECVLCSSSTLKESDLEEAGAVPAYGAAGISGFTDSAISNGDSILITKDGSGIGSLRYVSGPHSFVGTLNSMTPKDGVYLPYIYYALQNVCFETYRTGQAIPHIYFRDYGKEAIYCPAFDDQKRLAKWLELIDAKIKIERAVLRNLQSAKASLLTGMFI